MSTMLSVAFWALVCASTLPLLSTQPTYSTDLGKEESSEEVDALILNLDLPEEVFKEPFFKERSSYGMSHWFDKLGKPLSPRDFEAGRNLSEEFIAPKEGHDPLQKSGQFEGDIKDPEFLEGRNAIRDGRIRWKNGVVPYVVSREFGDQERSIIARGIEDFHKQTCIRLAPRKGQKDFVFITRGNGCFSMIGRQGGEQMLSIGQGCAYVGIVVHELMHAIGFWHEQSRSDRDNYVTVFWDNIVSGQQHNFAKFTDGEDHHLGEKYDYGSLMHYGIYEFSRYQDRPSILPNRQGVNIGQRRGFSPTDVRKINKLYHCRGRRGRPH